MSGHRRRVLRPLVATAIMALCVVSCVVNSQADRAEAPRISSESAQLDTVFWSPSRSGAVVSSANGTEPFAGLGDAVERKARAWLSAGLPTFARRAPDKPTPPPPPTLVKGEFESSSAFQERVGRAERDRAEAIRALERNYEREIREYNDAVTRHNDELRAETERRKAALPATRVRMLSEALSERLGDPEIRALRYDADAQTFYGDLAASAGGFQRRIAFRVPINMAPGVKARSTAVAPTVEFRLDGSRLSISRIIVKVDGSTFDATPSVDEKSPVATVVTPRDVPMIVQDLPKARPMSADLDALISANRRHFASISESIANDADLDDLRRKESDNARRMQEAERSKAMDAERQRLMASIRRQEERLDRIQDGIEPASVKEWHFRPAIYPDPASVIVVIIGNRAYGAGVPKVRFAANDARAIRQFAENALRVPPENILFEIDATKGTMEGIFQSRLPNLVERGRSSVIVYYSGHGMPVGDDAKLMPTDSRPDTARVTGYSRRELIEQLGRLGAKDVTLILDACFTGLSGDGPLLASAKPIMVRPVAQTSIPSNMILVLASQADEASWGDERSGLSLLTLHLLEGLSGAAGRSIDSTSIATHLGGTVDRHARRDWNQPQRPQLIGDNRVIVAY